MKWLVNAAGLIITAHIVSGIEILNYKAAFLAALILALLNVFIKPLLIIITLPINILSLGLFTLFINTFILYAASGMVSGFEISGFWSAFLGALCLSIVSSVLNAFVGPSSKPGAKKKGRQVRQTSVRENVIEAEVVSDEEKDKKLLE